jgi:hypothetical protein
MSINQKKHGMSQAYEAHPLNSQPAFKAQPQSGIAHRGKPAPLIKHKSPSLQSKTTSASQARRIPAAPPAYHPQPVPKVLQTKMASGQRSQEVNPSPQPIAASMARVIQPKSGARTTSSVIQCKNCVSCLHKAHAKTCTVQVAVAGGGTKACGCKSHSIKFDKSQNFNPGGGKRERMLANKVK